MPPLPAPVRGTTPVHVVVQLKRTRGVNLRPFQGCPFPRALFFLPFSIIVFLLLKKKKKKKVFSLHLMRPGQLHGLWRRESAPVEILGGASVGNFSVHSVKETEKVLAVET